MRPEYDFSAMKDGVRGKYYQQYRKGSNVVLLEPDVSKAFPTGDAVNEVLRGILGAARNVRRGTGGESHSVRAGQKFKGRQGG
jgi:hypothetical protein